LFDSESKKIYSNEYFTTLVTMNGYEITTAQNVRLRYEYASLGHRMLAYIIDNIVKVGFAGGMFLVGYVFLKVTDLLGRPILAIVLAIIFIAIPFIFYSLLFEYFMNGQSPGKRAMDIKVVSLDSEQLHFGQCLLRWIFRIVDFGFCYGVVALLAVAFSQKKQRVGDILAGTIVVNLKNEKTLDDTIFANVSADRTARYANAGRLSAREVEIIKEVIRQYDQEDKYDLLSVTADRVRVAIDAGNEQHDIAFLKAVVEDYYTLGAQ
jgi:uncharacterized RDD family membrane protein YckC